MNCCNKNDNCRQGRDCPVRRQVARQNTLSTELPMWPQPASRSVWRARLANIASVAGYAAAVMLGIGLVLLMVTGAGGKA